MLIVTGENCMWMRRITVSALLTMLATQPTVANNIFEDRTVLEPGTSVFIDNLPLNVTLGPDITLGARNENNQLIGVNDNHDPLILGDGTAPALFFGAVNTDGTINLDISGAGDLDFDGNIDNTTTGHSTDGEFILFVDLYAPNDGPFVTNFLSIETITPGNPILLQLNASSFGLSDITDHEFDVYTDNNGLSDLDYVTFTGLQPGAPFEATVTPEFDDFRSLLGLFDSNGNLIRFSDFDESSHSSLIMGTIPDDGEVHLAVTGRSEFDFLGDFDFIGAHEGFGDYRLDLAIVPEPTTAGILVVGGAFLTLRRRRAA